MKILMLTPYLPYPLWSGGQIRTYNLLKHLSKKHEITLVSFIRDKKETENIKHLTNYCIEVATFQKRPPWSFTSLALSGVTFYPLVVCMYLRDEVKKFISQVIEKQHFDLIHAETFYVMPNITEKRIPIILAEQTIEYLVYKHFTESVNLLPKRLLMGWDVTKIFYWEKRFWKKASRVVAMSQADKKAMQENIPKLVVDLVPNGVDTDFFYQKKPGSIERKKTVLFVGNFKWLQNKEAVSVLVSEIWPRIKKELPDAKLWIVGRFPPPDILKLKSADIRISPDIEDIREAYAKSDVLLAPIYGPGGTRYKILESMAMGLPVVTTTIGIEGLGVINKKEAIVADNPADLASQTVKVLTDKKLYSKLAFHSRKLVVDKFNWNTISKSLDDIYEEAAHAK